jgi:nicotinate dehydrogenase subunit B
MTLRIVRGADIFIRIDADGPITAYNGHVDLGTGIATALAQIVAEELDVAPAAVRMVLGNTARAPNQGPTIASETIQVTAIPLRQAAAQARAWLLQHAAARLEAPPDHLTVTDGLVQVGNRTIAYAELVEADVTLELSPDTPVKSAASYRVVGQELARVDIPAKAHGALTFVHDMRLPGMLHGRVVRPPYAGRDHGPFVGTSLRGVDHASIAHIPGVVAVVVIGDFIGVVAEREEQAVQAAAELRTAWQPIPPLPDLTDIAGALTANPSTPRTLQAHGDVDAALAAAATTLESEYLWPFHMHASIGPSCALADWRGDGVSVWSGTQNPHMLRADLATLLQLPPERVEVIRMEAAGCYGRNCADDVSADAVLLARATGRPVRVQLSREQEHAWEPKGAAQYMRVRGGLTAEGTVAGYDFSTRYPSNNAPILAALLTGAVPPVAAVSQMGDRTAIPPYDLPATRIVVHDMAPIVRAAWLRGVSALPNSFAHESFIDELAAAAGADPVDFRLRHLKDERATALIRATAERAGWTPRTKPGQEGGEGDILRGRGFAYAVYVHGTFPGTAAAWSAWVADVAVNRATGEVAVTRVTVGQDSGLMINPAGVRHQIEGNVIQSVSRVLKEQVTFSRTEVSSREWGGYPILTFPEVPAVEVLMLPRQDQPPLGVGESASVPSAAAIANAIYDATGVRFRELPFTPERIRAGLPPAARPRRRWLSVLGGLAALASAGFAAIGHAAIDPIARPDPSVYSAATIERGRVLAALGNCATCHTGPSGIPNAGGLRIETPFGAVYATNITPDEQTGIGGWSYPAFERAMRHGVHRDGRQLYPAFPYPSFTRTSDADLQALYAYLMAQPAVAQTVPETRLALPFARPVMAAWNALFLRAGPRPADPSRSTAWNRGAYLVDGLGHCGACHTPRNALGAERRGAYLGGGVAEGWEAPALTGQSRAPLPWTEQDFFDYLRTGRSARHGAAAGPMAPVVRDLAALPDSDIRAMAVYLASFNAAAGAASPEVLAQQAEARRDISGAGARIFDGACAACHAELPSLALSTKLHARTPDNLLRVILHGIAEPSAAEVSAMPGFAAGLDDAQLAELAGFLRRTYAPGEPAWTGLPARVAALR